MKKSIAVMLITVCIVLADVHEESLHWSDMQLLDLIMRLEYDGVGVTCINFDGNINIGVFFHGRWTESLYQIGQLGYAIGAVGDFTRETSWRSNNCIVVFSDYKFSCTTAAAREFDSYAHTWTSDQTLGWLDRNLIGSEYEYPQFQGSCRVSFSVKLSTMGQDAQAI